MCAEDQGTKDDRKARRRRKWHTVAHVIGLLGACIFVPFFVTAIWIGYLSWIGILVGIVYLAPGILSPIAGLAGKKRLEGFLSWLSAGMPMLVALVLAVAAVLPERDSHDWRPYSLDAELAALEEERAVPDDQNAALHYETALAAVDVNSRPDAAKGKTSLLRELSQKA